jgi:predicted nucleic acid-binding protein
VTLVVDASVVAAALADVGPVATWARQLLSVDDLAAPHLLLVEAAHVFRRAALSGELPESVAALAHTDLVALPIQLLPYGPFAERAWELRHTVTAYDAWYIAVAETLGAPLATLDQRLMRAPGPRCEFVTFDS